MQKRHFFAFFALHTAVLLYLAITTPITPYEAKLFYTQQPTVVSHLMHWGAALFSGVFGLRVVFLLMAISAVWGYYILVKRYLDEKADVYLSVVIFMFLPGIVIAGSMANIGIVVLDLLIAFLLLYETKHFIATVIIMILLFFVHQASIIFFLALFIFSVLHKKKRLAIAASTFFLAHLVLSRGIEIGGRPSGHFLDIFGLYATVFSPLLFLYFFFTMYRILLRGEKNIVWYISFTALIVSLLLSLRQEVYITDFAPYVMIATFLMVDTYRKSVRVRLPQFRTFYKRAFVVTMFFLGVTIIVALSAKYTYRFAKNPSKHFAARIYEPYELARSLKQKGIGCYDASGRKIFQLRFYGIEPCILHR
jgi:hypothetical protein